MSVELKVKAKSLAEESRIIRKEEQKMKRAGRGPSYDYVNLHMHRTGKVRIEARATHLARAFLKGMPYSKVEFPSIDTRSTLPFSRVLRLIQKYGRSDYTRDELSEWIHGEFLLKAA